MTQPKVVLFDIEGTLSPGKGLPYDLESLSNVRAFMYEHPGIIFSLCTGRSTAYVEAITQILDLATPFPCICEGGAVLYFPQTDMTQPLAKPVDIRKVIAPLLGLDYRFEPGKQVCASIYPSGNTTISDIFLAINHSTLSDKYLVVYSSAAVDVTPHGIDKYYGAKAACNALGISLSEVLFIGDANNDLRLLKACGYSAAPSNAEQQVKDCVKFISPKLNASAVVDILQFYFSP